MAAIYDPKKTYSDYSQMLEDPEIQAVVIASATSFTFLCQGGFGSGQACIREKPMGIAVEECQDLKEAVDKSGLILQVAL